MFCFSRDLKWGYSRVFAEMYSRIRFLRHTSRIQLQMDFAKMSSNNIASRALTASSALAHTCSSQTLQTSLLTACPLSATPDWHTDRPSLIRWDQSTAKVSLVSILCLKHRDVDSLTYPVQVGYATPRQASLLSPAIRHVFDAQLSTDAPRELGRRGRISGQRGVGQRSFQDLQPGGL